MDKKAEEQIKESLYLGVNMLKIMSQTPEFAEETAKVAMMYNDAFKKEGFTEEQSVILTAGVLSK